MESSCVLLTLEHMARVGVFWGGPYLSVKLHNSDVDSKRDTVLSSKWELKVSFLSEISPHPSLTSTYKKSTLHLMLITLLIN